MLYQNYPNPFNPSTTISYRLKERGEVKLQLYDIKGEMITELVNKEQSAGYYEVSFNNSIMTKTFTSGIYIYNLSIKDEAGRIVFTDIKKMILLK